MTRFLTIMMLTVLLVGPKNLPAQTITSEPSAYLKQMLQKHRLASQEVSFSLIELNENKTSEEFQADLAFVPASLMKVPTCHYALETLGPRHTMQTQLQFAGKDLILKGGGDPFLTATQLFNMVMQLHLKGIKKIEGNFFYDQFLFQPIKQISSLGSGDQTYNPAVGPLNIEFNRIRVQKSPTKATTQRANFKPLPNLDFIQLEKSSRAFGTRQKFVYVDQDKLIEKWLLSQQVGYSAFEEVPIRNPGLFAASLFHFFAKNLGIDIPAPTPLKSKPAAVETIYTHHSASILQLCEMSLEYSNNLFAESLLLSAALKMDSKNHTLESAAELMRRWYIQKYPAFGFQNAFFENGSGLSLKSRMSSRSLAQLLQRWQKLQYQGKTFWSLLSLAGQSGWLRNRLHSDEVAFRVFAKTGSLDFAHNMTGYLTGISGKNYAFAILVSDMDRRELIETEQNASKRQSLLREAGNYRQRANDFADELLEYWSKL